ncbi:MAG: hypothetical protein A2675_00800 [Candidatus Yonathbacteria bacterium RIFCSPHIGHO2_01_FULL_51_10]|uniref:DUF998 domain-containing protein n=1 Tax=Candidatus Yonathbacteria bacterium RIFCSPHIGHO2_01_FULL_51_10 TaxID=1802723 RepID=A0A1G2S7N8_9BACT|nr:MAG: hypothetical protein A2675_00800 [Candidatus Yonathbacteria bacterium RIFCSPHIGHO2_01_FULL_51_10]
MLNFFNSILGGVPDSALADTTAILNSYSFWSFVIVAVGTSVLVFLTAMRMKGGLFSKVLYYFGAGMVLIFLGYILVSVPVCAASPYSKIVHDMLYLVAYLLMALGANRLYMFTKGN